MDELPVSIAEPNFRLGQYADRNNQKRPMIEFSQEFRRLNLEEFKINDLASIEYTSHVMMMRGGFSAASSREVYR